MKLFYTYLIGSLYSLNLMAQTSVPAPIGTASQLPNPGPQVYSDTKETDRSKPPQLMSAEESMQALFHVKDLIAAHSALTESKDLFRSENGAIVYSLTLSNLFVDRQIAPIHGECLPIEQLYPDGQIPAMPRNMNYRSELIKALGEELLNDFTFSFQYLGYDFTDRTLWDVYVTREKNWIETISKHPDFSSRLKGFILANDMILKTCYQKLPFSSENKP